MKPTLVVLGARDIDGVRYEHGDEVPEGLLPQEQLDQWLDRRWLAEIRERRSLYRLFAPFSGSQERETFDEHELSAYGLQD
jgi:hypothetical protein